jgi:geranyl-CoA carboxylase alpha subunit
MTHAFDGGILIANRGEIALRVTRTARRLGYRTIAVYSDADRNAPHVAAADAAVCIGPEALQASYLDGDALLSAARASGASAIHPGYGFLAERPDFVARCESEGLTFIGPSVAALRAFGDKTEAKRLAAACGTPVLPGYAGADQSDVAFSAAADALGFPVMVKAAGGGGGRGMRLVRARGELAAALAGARAEASAAFGDPRLLLERALVDPRHVEVQIFGDACGNIVHLGERDCSLQRRFGKLIEEAPSPAVDSALRARLGEAAVAFARATNYAGAGTVEFLLDGDGAFWFIEANARLQVEHPVTEATTGIDLVEWQILVAGGEPLPRSQDEIRVRGHAIEARLCAEDVAQGFLPQAGTLERWEEPAGVRVDHALRSGATISPAYDSMLAKVIAWGSTRDDARRVLARALDETVALGVATNAAFLAACVRDPVFAAGGVTTGFVADLLARTPSAGAHGVPSVALALAAALRYTFAARRAGFEGWRGWSTSERPASVVTFATAGSSTASRAQIEADDSTGLTVAVADARYAIDLPRNACETTGRVRALVDGRPHSIAYAERGERCFLAIGAGAYAFTDLARAPLTAQPETSGDGVLRAPVSGRIIAVRVRPDEHVSRGGVAIVLDSMKIEHAVAMPRTGKVEAVAVRVGDQVAAGDPLLSYLMID